MAYKLRSKIKKAWVKALRSGEYKQCQRKLKDHDTGSYCCLGVLIEVTAKIEETDYDRYRYGCSNYFPNSLLIEAVFRDKQLDRSGVFDEPWGVKVRERKKGETPGETSLYQLNDAFRPKGPAQELTSLAILNDSGKYTFDQLADLIEEQM